MRTSPAPGQYIAAFDWLRAGAALAVVAYHAMWRGNLGADPMTALTFEGGSWLRYGHFAVQLFFLLSGFVMIAACTNRSPAMFIRARMLRLWPAFAACATTTAVIVPLLGGTADAPGLQGWLANLTMLAPAFGVQFMDGVYWTVVLELVFYFWVTMALAAGLLPRRIVRLCAAWLAVTLVNELLINSELLRHLFISRYAPWFIIGMLAAHLRHRPADWRAWSLVALAVLASMNAAVSEHIYLVIVFALPPAPLTAMLVNAAVLTMFAAALLLPIRRGAPALAALSYPVYLLHHEIGYAVMNVFAPVTGKWFALAMAVIVPLLVAVLVWQIAEPVLRRLLAAATAWMVSPVSARRLVCLRARLQA